jgi:hypothetical protein
MLLSITMRSVVLTLALVFAAAAACSDEKPNFGNAGGAIGRKLPGETAGPAGTAAPGADPKFGDKYDPAKNKPTKTLREGHATTGSPIAAGINATQSSACVSAGCHITGGAAPPWAFGGRVLKADKTGPEANADVAVVNPDNTLAGGKYVKTDADGFFYIAGGPIVDGAKTSVRTAKGIKDMSTPLKPDNGGQNDGACDRTGTCHGGTQGSIVAQ